MYMYYFIGYELLMKERDPTTLTNPNFDDVPSIFQLLSEHVKQKVCLGYFFYKFKVADSLLFSKLKPTIIFFHLKLKERYSSN